MILTMVMVVWGSGDGYGDWGEGEGVNSEGVPEEGGTGPDMP